MLIELYVLEAKNIQINKVLADRSLLPKAQLLTNSRTGASVVTSGSKSCNHAPSSYQNHSAHYKSPFLQNTHICCRWLISRNTYDCLATARSSQLMQIFRCHSCHTGIISVHTKSPPCSTQPCPKAAGFPRALTWSPKFNSRRYQTTKTVILFYLYCPAYVCAGH